MWINSKANQIKKEISIGPVIILGPWELNSLLWNDYNVLHSTNKVNTVFILDSGKEERAGWTVIYISSNEKNKLFFSPFSFCPPTSRPCFFSKEGTLTFPEKLLPQSQGQKKMQRQTSPTYTAQRDQLTHRKQRLKPLELGLGLTLTCAATRHCPTICTNVNFAFETWLLN